MKLSNPTAIKLVSLLASGVFRAWLGTLDTRTVIDEVASDPFSRRRRNIYVMWHETLLLPTYSHACSRTAILVSRHRDGELIAQVIRMLRGRCVRGSTDRGRSRGGATALRSLMRHARAHHLGIIADGPRGPRRVFQPGAIYLASRLGMPLVPSGFAFEDPWRVNSWDKMALPRPFRRARCVFASAFHVPPDIDRDAMEAHRLLAERAVNEAQYRAECLAAGQPTGEPLLTRQQERALDGMT